MQKIAGKIKSEYQGAYCLVEGFTLIEVMISVLIGTFILNLLFSIYLSSARIYKLQHEISVLQSNGNRASYLFKTLLGKKTGKFENIKHFNVKKTTRLYSNGSPIYSLYVEDDRGLKKEVIEGVAKLEYQCESLVKHHMARINCDDVEEENKLLGVLIKMQLTSDMLRREWHVYVSLV